MIPVRIAVSIWVGALFLGLIMWVPGWINRSGTVRVAESRLRDIEAYQDAVGVYQERWRDRTQEIRSQLPPPREVVPGLPSFRDRLERKRVGERATAELGPLPAPPNWVAEALGTVEETQLEVRLADLIYKVRRDHLVHLYQLEMWTRYGGYGIYAWGAVGGFLGIIFRRQLANALSSAVSGKE